MHPSPPLLSVIKPNPPPRWFVTNGEVTVGPVLTNLLKRGVAEGMVPDYCHVSPPGGTWRRVEAVREVAALHKAASATATTSEALAELTQATARIRDEDEVCYQVTRLAMLVTGAESAMFHFRERTSRSLVTRCVLGPVSDDLLNEELSPSDLLLHSARMGQPVFGPPYGRAEDALAMRFASTMGGVGGATMIPIFVDDSLRAMLEVSRPGHAFRRDDLQRAERIAFRALYQHQN
jgi:hypothetical protein